MLTGGLELSRPLAILWMLPAVGAILGLIAARGTDPRTHATVMTVLRCMLFGYLAGCVVLALWPLEFDVSVPRVEKGNWTPFDGTLGFLISENEVQHALGERDVLANVLLFVPLGLLLPFAFFQWRGIPLAIALLAFVAFALEFTQGLTIEQRTFDIDDAIAGFGGALAGTLIAAIVRPVTHQIAEPAPQHGYSR